MKLVFSDEAWEDYLYWADNNPKVRDRINELIKQCQRTPFKGVGKPEPLRGDLSGWWSRMISHEDRLVYRVSGSGGECPTFCVSVIWSMLPERSKDDDDFERTVGRVAEGLQAA